ncbi:MAG: STAS domain-containing protein [Armatimonadota bacterium]
MSTEVLQIGVSESNGTRVLRLTGELDSYTSERLANSSDSWINNADNLIINLDGLQYIDSSGLSALVSLWVKSVENGSKMTLSCRNPRIHRVLEITGLLNLFQMDNTGPEAKVLMGMQYGQGVIKTKIDNLTTPVTVSVRRDGFRR